MFAPKEPSHDSRQTRMVALVRAIDRKVERELWARAAGRCEFSGCNTLLYRSSITQESVHVSEKAHIYSFSEKGPRGWGPFKLNLSAINDISNLMLVCYGCHKTIDQDQSGERYSADLLIEWKRAHEHRVETVTGIKAERQSNVVLYGANIGTEKSPLRQHECLESMFPHWYPAGERPIALSMQSELSDSTPGYWNAERANLIEAFQRKVSPVIDQDDCKHFSVFALAPQPLLILLGSLFTDKAPVETYQLHREPRGWMWQDGCDEFDYVVHEPQNTSHPPALLLSLSDHVDRRRVEAACGGEVSIWEITIAEPHNDFLQSKAQLARFRQRLRKLMVDIKRKHGQRTPLRIFPVMPVACAIELGRIRMPKAEMPWMLFDHDRKSQQFLSTFEIKGDNRAR